AVGALGAEGGDLDGHAATLHEDDAEVGPDCRGAVEEGLDAVGGGAGGDVEISGGEAEQGVADAPAGEVGDVAVGGEGASDVCGDTSCGVGIGVGGHWGKGREGSGGRFNAVTA